MFDADFIDSGFDTYSPQWDAVIWEVAVQGEPGELGLEELEEMLGDGEA